MPSEKLQRAINEQVKHELTSQRDNKKGARYAFAI